MVLRSHNIIISRIVLGLALFVLLFDFKNSNGILIFLIFSAGIFTRAVNSSSSLVDALIDRIFILPVAFYTLATSNSLLLAAIFLMELSNALITLSAETKDAFYQTNVFGEIKAFLQPVGFMGILLFWLFPPLNLFFTAIIWGSLFFFMLSMRLKINNLSLFMPPHNQSIKIYNTLSKKKELFKPIQGKHVNLFVCGPTVYDFLHIGNARVYVFFDSFVKYLKHLGLSVFYLQNITDVDDKIIVRAREKKVLPKDLAKAFTAEYLKEMKVLGVTSVSKYANATDHIKEIINQVLRLTEKGYCYTLDDGVYFDISKFKDYGKLSGRSILQAEDSVSRIDYNTNKRNRGDFCLWKFNDARDGEPSWPAPLGQGRPGWHIEDTAITERFFGAQYDLHGGGQDLIFPHHEAEITLMETISGKEPLAKYWMHTGFLTIGDQKMSKSAGGMITINDFLKRYTPHQLRFLLLKNVWRSPLDYSDTSMMEVKANLEKIGEFLRKIKAIKKPAGVDKNVKALISRAKENFYQHLNDDFNTPGAFADLFDLIKDINKVLDQNMVGQKDAKAMYEFFKEVNHIFHIINFKNLKGNGAPPEVKKLLQERERARKNQDWAASDQLRAEIEKYGYLVQDTPDGPLLKKMQ